MKVSKKLFGAMAITCFLGFSQLTSAQTADNNTETKTEETTQVQEQAQLKSDSEVKKEKTELKAREEQAVESKTVKEEEIDDENK
ncbi:MAG TPA: hypothetical protein DHV22_16365 [Xanthomarina gelatinilytica]|uniref:Uncharacterized protein n=1 Tax=Xanthomarina gelatinilytica TaxID=1137281 RepID=A0A3D6BUV1_9FLAO|nr:hypothetical protein [Xanthomarina gelatinilytica]